MVSVVERDWSGLLVCLWEAAADLKEEKMQKENGSLSVTTHLVKSYSFISDTVVLTSALNPAASLRCTKHVPCDSETGIIIKVESIPATVQP